MRILVIEDDAALHKIISRRLRESGYLVDDCYDGEDGFAYADAAPYDCIVLDLLLPKRSGLDLLRELRNRGNRSSVLILTAMDAVEDRVTGLDMGADDYLVKPFSFDELLARVRAMVRRQSGEKNTVLTLADLEMDTVSHSVTRGGNSLSLTAKEYVLLEFLLHNQGHTLTRSQISDLDFDCDSNIVDVYIRYLRGKVDKGFSQKLIHTVRGFGYVMRCSDE